MSSTTRDTSALILIGTYTTDLAHVRGAGPGIAVCRFSGVSGEITVLDEVAATDASYLVTDAGARHVYVAEEWAGFGGAHTGSVAAYSLDVASARLRLLNRVASGGGGPVYVALSDDGRSVLVANYLGASVAVIPVAADGSLEPASQVLQFDGHGPHPVRQEQSHPHGLYVDADAGCIYLADLGDDSITGYVLDTPTGALRALERHFEVDAGSGPRHLRPHPDGRHVFVVNELRPSVEVHARSGTGFRRVASAGISPDGAPRDSIASELALHPGGRFAYAAVRGSDTIAVLEFDGGQESLRVVGHTSTTGATPRHLALDPSGSWLVVANQDGDRVVTFAVDAGSGLLTMAHSLELATPAFVAWIADG